MSRCIASTCFALTIVVIVAIFVPTFTHSAFSIIESPQSGPYDYIIFTNATSTYAMYGPTGEIAYQNVNSTALFASIPQGTSWYIEAGTYLGVISINQSLTSITGSGINSTIIICPAGAISNVI